MLTRILGTGVLAIFLAPAIAPAQSCDLTQLRCATEGNKCNIKFKNFTGLRESTCQGKSYSLAKTIKVMAKNDKGKDLGNTLSILAGASSTLNLSKEKKKNTSSIVVGGGGSNYDRGKLTCGQIKTILSGNGTCKVYVSDTSYDDNLFKGYFYFDCDGGNVCTKPPGY